MNTHIFPVWTEVAEQFHAAQYMQPLNDNKRAINWTSWFDDNTWTAEQAALLSFDINPNTFKYEDKSDDHEPLTDRLKKLRNQVSIDQSPAQWVCLFNKMGYLACAPDELIEFYKTQIAALDVEPEAVTPSMDDGVEKIKAPWIAKARAIAIEIHKENTKITSAPLAKKVHKKITDKWASGDNSIHTAKGTIPSIGSIKRHAITGICQK